MAITRTAWIDDDGTGTTGTVINNAEKTLLYDQIDAALTPSENYDSYINVATTGIQDGWNPGGTGHTYVEWNGTADLTLNSMADVARAGRRVTVRNNGGGGFIFVKSYTAVPSTPGRFVNTTNHITPIGVLGSATWLADGVYWRLVSHEQGSWITPAFNAANFSAIGSMTWTVAAGGVTICRYRLAGRTLTWNYYIQGTAAGTASNNLVVTAGAWGGYSQASGVIAPNCSADGGAGFTAASVAQGGAAAGLAATTIYFSKNTAPNWVLGAVAIAGSLTFEVT